MDTNRKAMPLDDEELDSVSGGKGVTVSKRLGYCQKCHRPIFASSTFLYIESGNEIFYYCEGHEPKGAKAPGKSC